MKNFEKTAAKAQSIGHRLNTMYTTVTQWEGLEPAVQRERMQALSTFQLPHAHMILRVIDALRSVDPEHWDIGNLAFTAQYIATQQYSTRGGYPSYSVQYRGEEHYLLKLITHSTTLSSGSIYESDYIDIPSAYGKVALWLAQVEALHPMLAQLETTCKSCDIPHLIGGTESLRETIQTYILGTLYDSMVDFNYDPDTIWVWQEPLLTADFLHRLAVQQHVFVDILEDFSWGM